MQANLPKALSVCLAVSDTLIDKPSQIVMKRESARGWRAVEAAQEEVVGHILSGRAIAPQFVDGHRKGTKFIKAQFLAADFDGTCTIDEARDNAFLNSFASFGYTTPSHSAEQHRFRYIFILETAIECGQDWADANLAVAHKCGSDPTVTDPARCFFGSSNADTWRVNRVVPRDKIDEWIMLGRDIRAARLGGHASNSSIRIDGGAPIKWSDGRVTPLAEIPLGTSVHCPIHDDRRPSAFVLRSNSGTPGVHCRTCWLTYFQDHLDRYDFDAFEKVVRSRITNPLKPFAPKNVIEECFPPAPECRVIRTRFLPGINYEPGITLIKSAKGTGKTTALKPLFADIRAQRFHHELEKRFWPKSVLMIGHRRALVAEQAQRLDLPFYLDTSVHQNKSNASFLAVCLDSLPAYVEAGNIWDVVILDEVEQVLAHLFGGTIGSKPGAVERCYDALSFVLRNAKAVIALDADLGMTTADALRHLRPLDWQSNTRVIVNEPVVSPGRKREFELFASEVACRESLIDDIAAGKRCFVTCNSRRTVNVVKEIIRNRCGSNIKVRSVTSENSRDPIVMEFIKNIREEILKIQVLICSPSLGTGVDITFHDPSLLEEAGLCRIDAVYGFFHSKVNTHTDMDQQLCRVRNPGAVKVWISPATFQYSSDFDVIRDDLARSRSASRAVQGYNADGMTLYDPHHPMLMILTHITAAQRASKNNLVELFCDLRRAQGWTIKPNDTEIKGNKDRGEAERKLWNEHAQGLANAPMLDDEDFLDLSIRRESGDPMTLGDRLTYERNTLERSLGVGLTYDIVKMNYDGKLLEKVETLSHLEGEWPMFWGIVERVRQKLSAPLARLEKMSDMEMLAVVLATSRLAGEGGLDHGVSVEMAVLAEFGEMCLRNQTLLEEIFGQPIRKDVVKNPIRQLNRFLKLGGLKLKPVKREKHQRKSVRRYGFDKSGFDAMTALARNYRSPDAVLRRLKALRE